MILKRRYSRSVFPCRFAILIPMLASLYSASAVAAAPLACESVTLSERAAEAVCTVPATPAQQAVRFKALFLGSHDDSEVSLQSTELDGVRVTCRVGSKTESRFEDGEVTLDCGFTAGASASSRLLKVRISLHHLQLDRTELAPD